MAVNFGNLDYFGHVPAEELKDTIRLIAYHGIRDVLDEDFGEKCGNRIDYIRGAIDTTEILCTQIDEEVADKHTEVERVMQEYKAREAHKEAGDTYAGDS